jgi:hypothetical protein
MTDTCALVAFVTMTKSDSAVVPEIAAKHVLPESGLRLHGPSIHITRQARSTVPTFDLLL